MLLEELELDELLDDDELELLLDDELEPSQLPRLRQTPHGPDCSGLSPWVHHSARYLTPLY